MRRTALLLALLALSAGAAAQQFKWVDRNGRTQYGDVPPPGVKATPLRAPARPAAAPPGKSAPASLAEREAEFRKRREEAAKSEQKQAQALQEAQAKKENCARAQASLRTLEAGGRIQRTGANGERYYLEDQQIAQETVKARELVREWCN